MIKFFLTFYTLPYIKISQNIKGYDFKFFLYYDDGNMKFFLKGRMRW